LCVVDVKIIGGDGVVVVVDVLTLVLVNVDCNILLSIMTANVQENPGSDAVDGNIVAVLCPVC
jgi:hypothetical protein